MELLGGQTVLYFISCGLSAVGLVLVIVGVATPEWTNLDVVYLDGKLMRNSNGLWRYCKDDVCSDIGDNKADSVKACETFGLLAVFSGLACFACLLIHMILQAFRRPSHLRLPLQAMVAGVLSAMFVIITSSVWGANQHQTTAASYVGYSLILTVIGGALLFISGFLGCLSSRSHHF